MKYDWLYPRDHFLRQCNGMGTKTNSFGSGLISLGKPAANQRPNRMPLNGRPSYFNDFICRSKKSFPRNRKPVQACVTPHLSRINALPISVRKSGQVVWHTAHTKPIGAGPNIQQPHWRQCRERSTLQTFCNPSFIIFIDKDPSKA